MSSLEQFGDIDSMPLEKDMGFSRFMKRNPVIVRQGRKSRCYLLVQLGTKSKEDRESWWSYTWPPGKVGLIVVMPRKVTGNYHISSRSRAIISISVGIILLNAATKRRKMLTLLKLRSN